MLAFYGSEEEWCGGMSELAPIRRNTWSSPRVDTRIIPGADHVYWGKAHETARLISRWTEDLGVGSHGAEQKMRAA